MAVRQIINRQTIPFDPNCKNFNTPIPEDLLEHEPNRSRAVSAWKSFQSSVTKQCKTRNSGGIIKRLREKVFLLAMAKLCYNFSELTEVIRVKFITIHHSDSNFGTKEKYALHFTVLSQISDKLRNMIFCQAEVPSQQQDTPVRTGRHVRHVLKKETIHFDPKRATFRTPILEKYEDNRENFDCVEEIPDVCGAGL